MNDFAVMQYAAGGMDAQRSALDVFARNVAVAQTADRTHPVHPLEPQFAVASDEDDDADIDGDGDAFARTLANAGSAFGDPGDDEDAVLPGQVAFAGARPSTRAITGIDAVSEMVSVLGAQRAFEANASVFDTGKRLIDRTLDVERS